MIPLVPTYVYDTSYNIIPTNVDKAHPFGYIIAISSPMFVSCLVMCELHSNYRFSYASIS
jgi:hypothetical protein